PPHSTPYPYTTLFRSKGTTRPQDHKTTGRRITGLPSRLFRGFRASRRIEPIEVGENALKASGSHRARFDSLHAAADFFFPRGFRSEEHTSELQSLRHL